MDRINQSIPLAPIPLVKKSPSWQQQKEEKERKKKEKRDTATIKGKLEQQVEPLEPTVEEVILDSEIEERGKKIDIQV